MKDKLETDILSDDKNELSTPKREPEIIVKTEPEDHQEKVEAVHQWIDDVFTQEQERLNKQGITSAEQWIKTLACIDKALTEHPKETLEFLAQAYGISFLSEGEKEKFNPVIIQCLKNLEQNQKILWQALMEQNSQTRQLVINNFAGAKDDEGKLLHPYFQMVKEEMFALLSNGVAPDYESAYEKALWLNPQIRAVLLEKQSAENLQVLAEEADKAKTAGFSPKGGLEKEDFSQMTTREILEHNYKKLAD